MANDYGLYVTKFVKGKGSKVPGGEDSLPSIISAVQVLSVALPEKVDRPPLKKNQKKVRLTKDVWANVSTRGSQVSVSWPFPSTGVPHYLQEVAVVTVTGNRLPEATVIAVAKHIQPN